MLVSRSQASAITAEIQIAVNAILAKNGMDSGKVSTKYGDLYSIKIEATPVSNNEAGVNVNTIEAQNWITYGTVYGFSTPDEALGKTFTASGRTFKLTGLNTKAPKMPVQAVCIEDGKSYKFGVEALKKIEGFAKEKATAPGF